MKFSSSAHPFVPHGFRNTVELRDYFRDDCVDAARARVTKIDVVSPTAAVVYPILLPTRLEVLVTLPGEVFVELGLAIKKASPFETTLVIELANDGPGYIPTSKAFAEGSYETVNSRVAPGGGEQMVELATRLLNELAGHSSAANP